MARFLSLLSLIAATPLFADAYTWPSPQYDALESQLFEGRAPDFLNVAKATAACQRRDKTSTSSPVAAEWIRLVSLRRYFITYSLTHRLLSRRTTIPLLTISQTALVDWMRRSDLNWIGRRLLQISLLFYGLANHLVKNIGKGMTETLFQDFSRALTKYVSCESCG